jgi:hypothetical protein
MALSALPPAEPLPLLHHHPAPQHQHRHHPAADDGVALLRGLEASYASVALLGCHMAAPDDAVSVNVGVMRFWWHAFPTHGKGQHCLST